MPNNWPKQKTTTLAFSTGKSQDFDYLIINFIGQELWFAFAAAAHKLQSSVLKEKSNVTKSWVAASALFSRSFPPCLTSPAMYSQPVSHSTDHFRSMHYSENTASAFNTEILELTHTTTFKQLCQVMFIEYSYCNTTEVGPLVWHRQRCKSCDLIAGAFLQYKMLFRLLLHRETRNEHKDGNIARNIPISTENFLDANSKYIIFNCGLDKIFSRNTYSPRQCTHLKICLLLCNHKNDNFFFIKLINRCSKVKSVHFVIWGQRTVIIWHMSFQDGHNNASTTGIPSPVFSPVLSIQSPLAPTAFIRVTATSVLPGTLSFCHHISQG